MDCKVYVGYQKVKMPIAEAVRWAITYDDDNKAILGAVVGAIVARMYETGAVEADWIERVTAGRVEVIHPTQEPPQQKEVE